MLSYANNVNCASGSETEVATWTADGAAGFVGFLASSNWGSGEWRLYIGGLVKYRYRTTPEMPTAFVVDKETVLANGTALSLRLYHDLKDEDGTTGLAQTAHATLLGG